MAAGTDANFCGIDKTTGDALVWDLTTLPTTTAKLRSGRGNTETFFVTAPHIAADGGSRCLASDAMGDPALQGCRGLGRLRGGTAGTIVTPIGSNGAYGFNLTLNGGSATPPCDVHGPNKGNRSFHYQMLCDAGGSSTQGPDETFGVVCSSPSAFLLDFLFESPDAPAWSRSLTTAWHTSCRSSLHRARTAPFGGIRRFAPRRNDPEARVDLIQSRRPPQLSSARPASRRGSHRTKWQEAPFSTRAMPVVCTTSDMRSSSESSYMTGQTLKPLFVCIAHSFFFRRCRTLPRGALLTLLLTRIMRTQWANAHPMNSEELLTKQCDEVMAADPSKPGLVPRCWVYRNTIKALNWYSSVREKLDDPRYSSWFIKFKGFSDSPYPGGLGKAQNKSYHVPTCDWYNNGTEPRCSGFYHDQEQTPEHPGGGSSYKVDGMCIDQCDCGKTNPCGEYIFDHRGGEVEGRTFKDWFVNEYMITSETLFFFIS